MARISFDGLAHAYPGSRDHALKPMDMAWENAGAYALLGPSGCGKTTLLNIVSGLLQPSEGRVLFDGVPVVRNCRKRTHRVQVVHQDPFAGLDPRMRVGDTAAEGPVAHGVVRRGEADGCAAALLERVGLDPALRRRYPQVAPTANGSHTSNIGFWG